MQLKTIYNQTIDTDDFENKGFGAFKEYVQKNIDKKWGTGNDIRKTKWEVTATTTATVYATIEIEAETEAEAEEIAKEEVKNISEFDWEISDIETWDIDIEIEKMKEEE